MVADVGTDHAYLPIYLVSAGVAHRAVASDINQGPLSRAEANIQRFSLSSQISTRLTPGLAGIAEFAPTDILICGMGGELIASILADPCCQSNPAPVDGVMIRTVLEEVTRGG